MIHTRPWSEVKREALAYRSGLLEALVSAPIERVQAIQVEVALIDKVIAWFEAPPPDETRVGIPDAASLY